MHSSVARDSEVERLLATLPPLPNLTAALKLHGINNTPVRLPPEGHVPQSSQDAVLTSFAQLGALRLHAQRGMICLVDSQCNYILTEATRTLSLRADERHDHGDQLWLGAAVLTRGLGLSEHVIEQQNRSREEGPSRPLELLVVNDLRDHEVFGRRSTAVDAFPHNRFFAGIPLVAESGYAIGAYLVYDDQPRNGLSEEESYFMRDMSYTVMKYLSLCRVRLDHQRKEQMLRGLRSFAQGMAELEPYRETWMEGSDPKATDDSGHGGQQVLPSQESHSSKPPINPPGSQLRKETVLLDDTSGQSWHDVNPLKRARDGTNEDKLGAVGARIPNSNSSNQAVMPKKSSEPTLQPKGAANLFQRAASIAHKAAELSGAVFFDASMARGPKSQPMYDPMSSRTASDATTPPEGNSLPSENQAAGAEMPSPKNETESSDSDFNKRSSTKYATVLGLSTSPATQDFGITVEELHALLLRYPRGRVFSLGSDGEVVSASDSSSGNPQRHTVRYGPPSVDGSHEYSRPPNIIATLFGRIGNARSLVLLPLWHYEQARWSTIGLFWTASDRRFISGHDDILFLRVFGSDLMNRVARLDAIAAEKTQVTFISSISHELRSPLHGILGSVQLLSETSCDAFQAELIEYIQHSGRTLLDIVDNVLDFSKINDFTRTKLKDLSQGKSKRRPRNTLQRAASVPNSSLFDSLDIGMITEEAIEATYAAQNFRVRYREWGSARADVAYDDAAEESTPSSVEQEPLRKRLRVILDFPSGLSSYLHVEAGAWRRIVMNLFGNALKFTDEGFVRVTLQVIEGDDTNSSQIKLTVTDTGRGMSPAFLQSKAFHPFFQEDSFMVGTGLGLSIVHRLVEGMSGRIKIRSNVGEGTRVIATVTFPKGGELADPISRGRRARLVGLLPELRHTNICLWDRLPLDDNENFAKGQEHHLNSLGQTLRGCLGLETLLANQCDPGSAHIVICPEPSFEALALLQQEKGGESKPSLLFVCIDTLEAEVVRNDVRIRDSIVPVEVITQPCGPYKLARALELCLKRRPEQMNGVSSKTMPGDQTNAAESQNGKIASATSPVYSKASPALQQNLSTGIFPDQPSTGSRELSDPRVLIVDDNPINLKLLAAFMKRMNTTFLSAKNGREAVDAYRSAAAGSIRTIFMDLSMPVLDGISAAREIRKYEEERITKSAGIRLGELTQRRPYHPQIIALTGLASTEAQIEARNAGFDKYITKPIRFLELKDIL